MGAACRAAPLLIAASIPAAPLPPSPPLATIPQPELATQPVQTDPGLPLLLLPPGFAAAFAPGSAYDPVQDPLPPPEVAGLTLAAPLPDVPVAFADPAAPTVVQTPSDPAPVPAPSQSGRKPVPEPSSLAVFMGALAALRLLRRRRPARC